MNDRRLSLPGADELFRSTARAARPAKPAKRRAEDLLHVVPPIDENTPEPAEGEQSAPAGLGSRAAAGGVAARRRPSGRERHDEKITVYVSSEELMDLEQARLTLRAQHGLAVDRGRIVREAVALVLEDLSAHGDASILVRRLRGL